VQLNQSLGITVVIVTHDQPPFSRSACLALLVDKKITVDTLDQLMHSHQPWIHEFLHGPRAQGSLTAGNFGMETDRHYFIEGLFIIGFSVAAALFFVWLSNTGHRDDVLYRIHFAESVSGLALGDPVKYRGVDVGNVKAMALDPDDPRRVQVDVSLRKEAPVKTDTAATLKLRGITGTVFIELEGGSPDAKVSLPPHPRARCPKFPPRRAALRPSSISCPKSSRNSPPSRTAPPRPSATSVG
jgi:phospholipid/cholesterol/gamma-HCH transport system substrate-binding protein